jgi:predicted P-loop ATPase
VVTKIFTSDLSRKILCAALVKVFELGFNFNFVMILEGKQGKVIDQEEKNEHLKKIESLIKRQA